MGLHLRSARLAIACFCTLLGACSSDGGDPEAFGMRATKPGGGTFFVDANQGGRATRVHLVEMLWGRLVNVHALDQDGQPEPEPVFVDYLVDENVRSDGVDYLLETNPATQVERLVILRQREAPARLGHSFDSLLAETTRNLAGVIPRGDDGTWPAPFSMVPRNACVMLRFDDCLDDSPTAAAALPQALQLRSGYPPRVPLSARTLFDPNHGALVRGAFHSTRILVDFTVSELEASGAVVTLPINTLGLPASAEGRPDPNLSLRLPTRLAPIQGQFQLLRGHSGAPLAARSGEPVDPSDPSLPLVRAFRSGHAADRNNGFLLDTTPPRILGEWPVSILAARPGLGGGLEWRLDLDFTGPCRAPLQAGDTFLAGGHYLEVSTASPAPVSGRLLDVPVRLVTGSTLTSGGALLGSGTLLTTFAPRSTVAPGCWLRFSPPPAVPPATDLGARVRATVRFSKPIDPASVTPFDTLMMLRGDPSIGTVHAEDLVTGTTSASPDLLSHSFVPVQDHAHAPGTAEVLHVRIGEVTDLAGNGLAAGPPPVPFTLDPALPAARTGSVAMRFSSLDELPPRDVALGIFDDLRGQVTYDFDRGRIRPRPVSYQSHGADRSNPIQAIMIPFTPGIQTPLTSLGSKLQTVWRYADFGWSVTDETKYNLDVYGLHWSPRAGAVLRDRFDEFEIRLAHSVYLPDERVGPLRIPRYQFSGLHGSPDSFTDNILQDARSPQTVVHPRSSGYEIRPTDLFHSAGGTPLMPYPLNRTAGQPLLTFTWRDTAVQAVGGPFGAGVPLDIESGPPLSIAAPSAVGSAWATDDVPSVGLPLLMEFRCYPSSSALGLNPLDISLALNSSATPSFRVFSSGGTDSSGRRVTVDPDLAHIPTGGFNPSGRPPGKPTNRDNDNAFYIGQLDVVTRVSRAVSVWIDTGLTSPHYLDPVLVPAAADQPAGTRVLLEYRGADSFAPASGSSAFDAAALDPYGDVVDRRLTPALPFAVQYRPGGPAWQTDIRSIDGARYLQLRFTFVNDLVSGLSPELSAVGLAFAE